MKCTWHGFRLQNADRGRQGPVQGAVQVFRRNGRLQSETGHLGQRMDAGVGASRALGQGRFAGDMAKRRLQLALDGTFAGLHLPAVEIGAVVGQGQLPGSGARDGLGVFVTGISVGNRVPDRPPATGAESTEWDILSFLHG